MPEDKYAQMVVEQCFDLLERFLQAEGPEELFISNRALSKLLKRVHDHLGRAFDSENERRLFRQLQGKLDAVSKSMFELSETKQERVFTGEKADRLLDRWCEAPEFES